MQRGKIIFLNGVSSSGKTTLAKTLQARLPEPYYWLSVDTFMDMTPEKHMSNDDDEVIKTISAMYRTIKTFSDMGLNTVVDDVFSVSQELLDECVEILHEYPVLFVHVTCPLEELQRREKERGDRTIGQAEEQLSVLLPLDNTYDVTVDTHNDAKEKCADKIIELLDCHNNYTAFKILWKQRNK